MTRHDSTTSARPLLIRNARLLDPESGESEGAVLVADGRIQALGVDAEGERKGCQEIRADGLTVAPGIVDTASWAVDPRAALAGGITTVLLMPDAVSPVIDHAAMVALLASTTAPAGPRVRPVGALSRALAGEALAELGLMAEAGAIAFSDGRRPVRSAQLMRRALTYARRFGRPVICLPLEPDLAAGGVMHEGEMAAILGLPGIPAEAECIQLERDARLARLAGESLHFFPLTTAEGVHALARLQKEGAPVTAGTTPAYFHLNDMAVGEYRSFARLDPPLRSEDDRLAVQAAVAAGTIAVIASAHTPLGEDDKRRPFEEAAPGAIGYETLLPLSLALVRDGLLDLAGLWRRLTTHPARIFGLESPRLRVGAPADLVLFDPDEPWRVEAAQLVAETDNTPFDGLPVTGRAVLTMVGGIVQFDRRGLAAPKG